MPALSTYLGHAGPAATPRRHPAHRLGLRQPARLLRLEGGQRHLRGRLAKAADEVFVTGTMGGLVLVLTIDRRQIGSTRPGPVTALLAKGFADLTATTGTPVC